MTDHRPRTGYTGPPATLANHDALGFRLKPTRRACWHVGAEATAAEFARRFGLSLDTPHPEIDRRLVCTRCGERKGYLQLLNPMVNGQR